MKKIIVSLAVLALVAGCAEYQTAKPVDVKFSKSAQQGVRGYSPMPVRAFKGQVAQNNEIIGVPCEVIGSGFSAKVVTPAAVNMPMYGAGSKAVYVKCTYEGEKLDTSFAAQNITENKAMATGANAGLLGVLIVGAVVAGRTNKDSDEYGYPGANLVFKKKKGAE